ncbi:unnamed protein product, partial [Scytosiphon promiscuus]
GRGGGDRRAEVAAAKCRWNCCIALGVVLSARGVRARVAGAFWSPALMLRLRRAVVEDDHLKVRTHAAHALKAVPDVRSYGDQLPSILGGCLRGLQSCKRRTIVPDPTQTRYAGDLEAALLSLALHILLSLVLGTSAASQAGIAAAVTPDGDAGGFGGGGGSVPTTAALLAEYADDLLDVLSSPESDTALSSAELAPYYDELHRDRCQINRLHAVSQGVQHQRGFGHGDRNQKRGVADALSTGVDTGAGSDAGAAICLTAEHERRMESPLELLQAGLVIAETADRLVRLLDRGEGCGGGVRDHGAQSPLVSKQTLAACSAEAARRRLYVDRLLAGDSHNSSRETEGFPCERAGIRGEAPGSEPGKGAAGR